MKKKEIREIIQKIVEFVIKYKQQVSIGLGICLICISLALYFILSYRSLKMKMFEKISAAQNLHMMGKDDEAIRLLDEIISRPSRSSIYYYAQLIKANILYDKGNYKSAKELYSSVVKKKSLKFFLPFAYAGLSYCEENLQNYQEAIKFYNLILEKYADHFITPKIYESLARVYEVIGSSSMARSIYEKITILYPGTYWSSLAQEKISSLKK